MPFQSMNQQAFQLTEEIMKTKGFAILPKVINSKFVWLRSYFIDDNGKLSLSSKDTYADKIRNEKAKYSKANGRVSK